MVAIFISKTYLSAKDVFLSSLKKYSHLRDSTGYIENESREEF